MSMELINELQRADVALQAARNANNAAFEDYQTAKADRDGLQEMTTDNAIACTHVKRAETIHSATCNCPAALHGRQCYHVAAARILTAV